MFQGNTAVMAKRRYRDRLRFMGRYIHTGLQSCSLRRTCRIFGPNRWNRVMTRRVSKKHNHSIKIKTKGACCFSRAPLLAGGFHPGGCNR